MARDKMVVISLDGLHRYTLLPRLSGFSLSPFRAYSPSIFLFFLNVIVKCSSEMTLNMCTLTEGIHLVIYFLLTALCGLFIVSLFSNLIQSPGGTQRTANCFETVQYCNI